ncbi:MAG: MFS transporter [Deltaproteobacteria bacterium]|nr:MFS transporter [Deltaproteobacteria bacterium]
MSTRPAAPLHADLALLALLYLAQGMPFGLQSVALPVLLRQHGASLEQIGLAGALALPWLFKVLWAPAVDRWGTRWGWIAAMQTALLAVTAAAAAASASDGLDAAVLAWTVLALNFAAATQDIAVDGLAVHLLGQSGLGWGNAAQVVGYKAGMIVGGGVLVWASAPLGWPAVFALMAALYALLLGLTLRFARRTPAAPRSEGVASVRAVTRVLAGEVTRPGAVAALAIVLFYKTGETVVTTMFKPFLVDRGFTAAQIGQWVGIYGMVASVAGSLTGGWWVQRKGPQAALLAVVWLRAVSMAGEVAIAAIDPSPAAVIGATCIEHLCGGALTTAMFAWMMARVDPRIAGSHYTLLASLEVLGKMPAGWASGWLAAHTGYFTAFGAGMALSLLYAAALPLLQRRAGDGGAAARA